MFKICLEMTNRQQVYMSANQISQTLHVVKIRQWMAKLSKHKQCDQFSHLDP